MYTEIATIKDQGNVTGFLVYDGKKTQVMSLDDMKTEAAAGNVDTLSYKDGKFIPIIQGALKDELKKKSLFGRTKKLTRNMTFEDFVDLDAIFEASDVKCMEQNLDVILVTTGLMYDAVVKGRHRSMLVLSMWVGSEDAKVRIEQLMTQYEDVMPLFKNRKSRDGSILFTYALNSSTDILLRLSCEGYHILWNFEAFDNMEDRCRELTNAAPWLVRMITRHMIPTSKRIEEVKRFFMNQDYMARLKLRGEADGK